MAPKVLVVVTSFGYIESAKRATGWYLPELAHPYDVLAEKGVEITIVSPKGGAAPIDPYSIESTKEEVSSSSFLKNFKDAYENTEKVADYIGRVSEFDALYFPGGAGPMWDLAIDENSQALIAGFIAAGKPVAAVCHGPIAFQGVKLPNGEYYIAGKQMTALSDPEEEYYALAEHVPFSLEGKLKERGAIYVKAPEMHGLKVVVEDGGKFITGQNLNSAKAVGEALVKSLGL